MRGSTCLEDVKNSTSLGTSHWWTSWTSPHWVWRDGKHHLSIPSRWWKVLPIWARTLLVFCESTPSASWLPKPGCLLEKSSAWPSCWKPVIYGLGRVWCVVELGDIFRQVPPVPADDDVDCLLPWVGLWLLRGARVSGSQEAVPLRSRRPRRMVCCLSGSVPLCGRPKGIRRAFRPSRVCWMIRSFWVTWR